MNSNQFAWPKVVRKSGFHRILYESLAHYGNACEKINGMYCLKKRLTGFHTCKTVSNQVLTMKVKTGSQTLNDTGAKNQQG